MPGEIGAPCAGTPRYLLGQAGPRIVGLEKGHTARAPASL